MARRLLVAAFLALGLGAPALLAQNTASAPAARSKNPLTKLAEPWPDEGELATRRTDAQNRRLFQDGPPIEFRLTADFNLINKERTPNNGKLFPGVLTVDGREIAVKLSSRGHVRLKPTTCEFVPIKIEFPADQIAGTVFDGQTSLKLGTHCQNGMESDQYVTREYLTYRLANLVTPWSFRARLARATYVEAKSNKTISTHAALFLEHENDVARRLTGRDVALPHLMFKDLDMNALTSMLLLEYMLGNVDYSIYALHNVVIVQDRTRKFFPVPYDFDLSAMVHPPYAVPEERLHQRSVLDRIYRGPCRSVDEFNAAVEPYRTHKAEMIAVVESTKELNNRHKGEMKDYLDSFFKRIETPDAIRKTFVDGCHTTRERV